MEHAAVIPLDAPNGGDALPAAALWIEQLLVGSLATAIATLAVAGLGFALLYGYLSYRRGIRIILGCFILFGAGGIASALNAFSSGDHGWEPVFGGVPPTRRVEANTNNFSTPTPINADPYAGATTPGASGSCCE